MKYGLREPEVNQSKTLNKVQEWKPWKILLFDPSAATGRFSLGTKLMN